MSCISLTNGEEKTDRCLLSKIGCVEHAQRLLSDRNCAVSQKDSGIRRTQWSQVKVSKHSREHAFLTTPSNVMDCR